MRLTNRLKDVLHLSKPVFPSFHTAPYDWHADPEPHPYYPRPTLVVQPAEPERRTVPVQIRTPAQHTHLKVTEAQLAGYACLRCGGEHRGLIPFAVVTEHPYQTLYVCAPVCPGLSAADYRLPTITEPTESDEPA